MKNVILFDGEAIKTIDLEYFFQDEWIESLNRHGVTDALINSLVFEQTLDEIKDIEEINEDAKDPLFRAKVKHGCDILEGMLRDMMGDHLANRTINHIKQDIACQ